MKPISQHQIERWITAPRFKVYLDATGGDYAQAMALYDWNVCISAVFFEVLGYTEVLLRNAIDARFEPQEHRNLAATTWLHDSNILTQKTREQVADAEERIRSQGKTPTRARVVASLSFGFWRALFNKQYKQLWITDLHKAFPNGNGERGQVAKLLAQLNPFRNRLAHHDAIIAESVSERHDDLLELARLIDADAARWIGSRSCVPTLLEWRPPLSGFKRALTRAGQTPRTVRFHLQAR